MSKESTIVKPGPYLLTQDVPNPKADRRSRHRWTDAAVFRKGWMFVVRERPFDRELAAALGSASDVTVRPSLVLTSKEDSYVEHEVGMQDERALALEPFLEYDNDLIREIRFELSHDYIDLEEQAVAYVKQALRAGRITREDFVKFARENHAAECAAYERESAARASATAAAGEP